jgi:dipeptidyl aminopeptidase/acylaminoacyl peptidase
MDSALGKYWTDPSAPATIARRGSAVGHPASSVASLVVDAMRTFTPADALKLRFLGEAALVPGGRFAYYVVVDAQGELETRSLWRFNRTLGSSTELRGSFTDPHGVRPSPAGDRLAFVAAEPPGVRQLWVVGVDGEGLRCVTNLEQGVYGPPEWSPSGQELAFAAPPRPTREPSSPYRITRHSFAAEGIGMIDDALRDLFVVDVLGGACTRLTDDDSLNEDPRWSPDGGHILFRASFPPDREWTAKPSASVIEIASRSRRDVTGDWGGVFAAEWSPDGQQIIFVGKPAVPGLADAYWQKNDVFAVGAAGGEPTCLTGDLLAGTGHWIEFDHPSWAGLGGRGQMQLCVDASRNLAYVSAQRGGDVGICAIDLAGRASAEFVVEDADRTCFLIDTDPTDGALLYTASTFNDPPELFLRDRTGEHRVTQLNGDLFAALVRPEVMKLPVRAGDDVELDGWALKPTGDGPFPTVLAVHSGPCNAFGNVFHIDHQLLVGAGFAVVMSNFRGSGGYGNTFHQGLEGRWGEVGEGDHMATIDRAIEVGIADPSRLGVFGISHGGFATCWLAGRSNRFKAGVAENPAVDFASAYATMDDPWWLPLELRVKGGQEGRRYEELSALPYATRCATPLLFIVGEADLRCDPSQAEQYYRVLKQTGCPSEMLRLPGSNHLGSWTGPIAGRAAQNEALVDWFSRYLAANPGTES